MAVTPISYSLTEVEAARKGGIFTATLTYTLYVDITAGATFAEMLPDAIAGLFDPDLPIEGSAYPGRPLVSCRGVSCNQTSGGVYSYKAEFSDENSKDDEKAVDENPLLDLPVIKPIAGIRERALTKNRDGEAILNTAGDPIAQSIEDNTVGLSVSVNVAVTSGIESLALSFRNAQNDSPIQVGRFLIGTEMARFVLPSDWLSEVQRRNDIEYLTFRYELLIDETDLHHGRPLNAGFRQKAGLASPERQTILNSDASEPSEPVSLDANGLVLDDPAPDTVIYLDVEKYQLADFTGLPGITAWSPGP